MNTKQMRAVAIKEAISNIREIMTKGININQLEAAKVELMRLCAKAELFPRSDFPIPRGDQTERTFLVYEDDNGEYALYVNSGGPGQESGPHNHGGSWAIIAAIEGEESHRLYVEDSIDLAAKTAEIRQVSEIAVKPGSAVAMLEDGIHSIHAGFNPLLHLHLYGKSYASQMQRKVYDMKTGSVRSFFLEDVGFVEDAR